MSEPKDSLPVIANSSLQLLLLRVARPLIRFRVRFYKQGHVGLDFPPLLIISVNARKPLTSLEAVVTWRCCFTLWYICTFIFRTLPPHLTNKLEWQLMKLRWRSWRRFTVGRHLAVLSLMWRWGLQRVQLTRWLSWYQLSDWLRGQRVYLIAIDICHYLSGLWSLALFLQIVQHDSSLTVSSFAYLSFFSANIRAKISRYCANCHQQARTNNHSSKNQG